MHAATLAFYVGAGYEALMIVWPQIEPSFGLHRVPCLRLPPELFEQLQMLLEPNSVTGNDWRRLASHLGLCGMKIR